MPEQVELRVRRSLRYGRTGMRLIRAIVLAAASTAALMSASLADDAFPITRGFNTFPWMYRAALVHGGGPRQFDYARIYPYEEVFTDRHFQALHDAGADVIRIQLDPSPFLVQPTAEQRGKLLSAVGRVVDRLARLGLSAIVSPFPREASDGLGALAVLRSAVLMDRYAEMIAGLAATLGAKPNAALEMMNEPASGWGWFPGSWSATQKMLMQTARKAAPTLRLIATGDRGGGVDGLLRLDPKPIDDENVLYSFHYYDPMVLTHQGATWGSKSFRPYLAGIEYPPDPANKADRLAEVHARIVADGALSDKDGLSAKASEAIGAYYDGAPPKTAMTSDFAKVKAWADRHGISPRRIVLGEFGIMRPNVSEATAVNLVRDLRTLAEKNGFAWVVFNYAPTSAIDQFHVLDVRGPDPNALDKALLNDGLGLNLK